MIDAPADARPGRASRRLVLLPLVIFGALALLFLVSLLRGRDPSQVPSALIGRPAPSARLDPLPGLTRGGEPVPGLAPEDLKGRVTVVNVWASWCAPCRQEHPILMELAGEPGVAVVGINYKDQAENARRFLGALGNPYGRVGTDPNGRAAIDWGVYGVPETFIVGPDGTIRHKHIGPLTSQSLPAFRERLAAAR